MNTATRDVSIRDQIVPVAAGQSLFDVLRIIGTNSVEASVSTDLSLPCLQSRDGLAFSVDSKGSIQFLKQRLDIEGARISALLIATDFSCDDADRHVAWASAVVRAASELGTPVVRIDPLTACSTLAPTEIRDNFVRRTVRVLEQTADTTVDVGMENHGPLFNDPDLLDEVLTSIPDNRFGLTLDTGNFYWWGLAISEVYRVIERFAPRTKHTHIKNICYPPGVMDRRRDIGFEYKRYCCPLGDGNLDLRRIVRILRESGYQRDLCVEDESFFKVPEVDQVGVLRRDVDLLRTALAL